MDLSEFIRTHLEEILTIWEHDAKETLPRHDISRAEVRDHLEQILQGIAAQLERPGRGRDEPSVFNADHPDSQAYAVIHGRERFALGLEVHHIVKEFQALRMTIMELWSHSKNNEAINYDELIRFNYEIDRVLDVSVECYVQERQNQKP